MSAEPSPFLDRPPMPTDRALALLREGAIEIRGRMPYSSNATFLVDIAHAGLTAQGIYKPTRGERPLWDFPTGLAHREAAAFEVDDALGWGLVPPTIVRHDAPFGTGSIQLFMPSDFSAHYFTLREDDAHRTAFQRVCALDVVINNTDRKSGHCLLGDDGRIWAIDNGLTFHQEFKLRTVVWEFAGDELPESIRRDLWCLLERGLPPTVIGSLTREESRAVLDRARSLATNGQFPVDDDGRRWPWPLV
ncbi:MAG: SCO1664 family protein [Acidimicrobiales bacterium]